MRRQRLFFAVGTRPEAERLAPLVRACKARPNAFEAVVCFSGECQQLAPQLAEEFGLFPACDLQVTAPNQNPADLASRSLRKFDDALAQFEPDVVVVQGESTTAATASQAAYYRRLRVVHVCGDDGDEPPATLHRRMVATAASMHCASTPAVAEELKRLGVPSAQIRVIADVEQVVAWLADAATL